MKELRYYCKECQSLAGITIQYAPCLSTRDHHKEKWNNAVQGPICNGCGDFMELHSASTQDYEKVMHNVDGNSQSGTA